MIFIISFFLSFILAIIVNDLIIRKRFNIQGITYNLSFLSFFFLFLMIIHFFGVDSISFKTGRITHSEKAFKVSLFLSILTLFLTLISALINAIIKKNKSKESYNDEIFLDKGNLYIIGRSITKWGLGLYLTGFIVLEYFTHNYTESKFSYYYLMYLFLIMFFFTGVIRGNPEAKSLVTLMLILGIFTIFVRWRYLDGYNIYFYKIIFSIYGFCLGLVLLLSKSVKSYLKFQNLKYDNYKKNNIG